MNITMFYVITHLIINYGVYRVYEHLLDLVHIPQNHQYSFNFKGNFIQQESDMAGCKSWYQN